jgi:hypothetical protein
MDEARKKTLKVKKRFFLKKTFLDSPLFKDAMTLSVMTLGRATL